MENLRLPLGAFLVLPLAMVTCQPLGDHSSDLCEVSRRECHLTYSISYGYQRACATSSVPCPEPGPPKAPETPTPTVDAGAPAVAASHSPAPASAVESGAAALPDTHRYSAFDFACTRDSQCGPGRCIEGDCYYGCQEDAQCGSGDRCGVETGTRICIPDPNPPVECTRTAQCAKNSVCLNASCRQTCATTEDCSNLMDRCASGVCQPDRRPLDQCVVNSECPSGSVCLDGSCVDACRDTPDGGVCLSGEGKTAVPPANPPLGFPSGSGGEPGDAGAPDAALPDDTVHVQPVPIVPVDSVPAGSVSVEPVPIQSVPVESVPVESVPGPTEPTATLPDAGDTATVDPLL